MYHKVPTATHLFIVKNEEILLLKRKNTGYHDGDYSVPAGHIEDGESVIDSTIREAKEEIGITLFPRDFEVCQVIHRRSEEVRVDFFVQINSYQGIINNCEPEKCSDLSWFKLDDLPINMIPYVEKAIVNFRNGNKFDVLGWE
jgi:8-oxo-dGTP diphosphatase